VKQTKIYIDIYNFIGTPSARFSKLNWLILKNLLAEVHGNRTHPIKIIAVLDQSISNHRKVKVKEKLKDKGLFSECYFLFLSL